MTIGEGGSLNSLFTPLHVEGTSHYKSNCLPDTPGVSQVEKVAHSATIEIQGHALERSMRMQSAYLGSRTCNVRPATMPFTRSRYSPMRGACRWA